MSLINKGKNLQYKNDGNEENLAKMAAMRIAKRELDAYELTCQENIDLHQIPDYQAFRNSIGVELVKAERRYRMRKSLKWAGRLIACLAFASVLTTGALYITVDAARNTINNFFLELHDGYAILHGNEEQDGIKAPLPENWAGPATPEWIPERFTNVAGTEMHFSAELAYFTETSDETLLISIWAAEANPAIDRENMFFSRTLTVQGVPASMYIKSETKQLYLDFTINGLVIQICGDVSEQEIIKIAENIKTG